MTRERIERVAVAIANRGTVELSLDADKACCLHGICQEELATLVQYYTVHMHRVDDRLTPEFERLQKKWKGNE